MEVLTGICLGFFWGCLFSEGCEYLIKKFKIKNYNNVS